ncbi:MAG: hypothetical protein IPJ98_11525 [Bryobacterales bacterium]|nr:hypothetical protein [Bryobacterales bacterium]
MPMTYPHAAIQDAEIPRAREQMMQHALDTYASETNRVYSVWTSFAAEHLDFRPHSKSSSVAEIMRHQLFSERRFFGEFLGAPEAPAADVMPREPTAEEFAQRLVVLARPRLAFLAEQPRQWWLTRVSFFDVERERVWVLWRRVLHTAHHRTQLTVYQRLLDSPVLATYGPTADVTWEGADPTHTVEAASRAGGME